MYLKTNCENKKPYQLGNYPCQLGLFPYFLPKTHSWYYPIIRDFSLFIRQKSLIVMVLWAHFLQKAASIFTAKFFMNFPQILKRFHRFFLDFQSVLFMSYLVCILFTFTLYFCWILIEWYGQTTGDDVTHKFLAKITQNHQKNPRIYCKMSIKFIQKSTELNRNPYQNTYLHNKHSYSKCKLWKSKLSCLSPQISLTALIFLWNQCFSLVF